MAEMGFRKFEDLVGRTDLIEQRTDIDHWKASKLDLSQILYRPKEASKFANHCTCLQKHKIEDVMDHELIKLANKAIKNREKVWISKDITNTDRTVGAMLSGEITRIYGEAGFPDGTMICKFKGSAGQSFGAFLVKGVHFELEGDSNDYLGKGFREDESLWFLPGDQPSNPKKILSSAIPFFMAPPAVKPISGVLPASDLL